MQRAVLLSVCLWALGCGEEAEVVDAPKDATSFFEPCDAARPCGAGKACQGGFCVAQAPGEDTSQPPGQDTTASPPDTAAPMDVPEADDTAAADIEAPEDASDPADLADPVDTGPDDTGPPPEDQCPVAGQPCQDVLTTCRVSNQTGGLECSGSTGFKPLGAPCTQHVDCDLNYGCHEGICTVYCEVQFGCAKIPGQQCVAVGHPTWGACVP